MNHLAYAILLKSGLVVRKAHAPVTNAYLALMAQRDLPAQPMLIQRLFRMLAALHGQMWNASQG